MLLLGEAPRLPRWGSQQKGAGCMSANKGGPFTGSANLEFDVCEAES